MGEASVLDRLPGAIAKAEKLPSPPTVALEVLRVSNDENATIDDLAAILSRDPALSAKILKLANSSMFRRGDAVSSLDAATMRLGLKTVKLMALSFSLTDELPRKSDRGFDYIDYWRRSLTMAVAGRALARLVRNPHGDEAFLCGLLGRLGQIVMAECIPDEYGALIQQAEGELPPASLEAEQLGYDSHEVGAALLDSWQLPPLIVQTVRGWGDPEHVSDDAEEPVGMLARIMALANATATVLCRPQQCGSALKTLYALGTEYCGVSEDEIDAFVVSLEQDVSEMASMLNMDVDGESYQGILDRARMEMVQISLGAALDLEQTTSRAEELERKNQELESKATTDKLTGIPNRAQFDETLERVVAARISGPSENALGLLVVDVDHFKKFNDTHGHQTGDEVLKLVARCLSEATRDTDLAARYGGEEFVVVLGNTTLEILETVAERIRKRVAETALSRDGEPDLSVTASVGGACVERVASAEDGEALLALADACLYEAKEAGRNRFVCRRVESTADASA